MKILTGKVISAKTAKTVKIAVTSAFMHRLYKKRFTVSKNYLVHDEIGTGVGDMVSFVASRPYSKMKKWKVLKIVGSDNKVKKGGAAIEGKEAKRSQKENKVKTNGKGKNL